MSQGIVNSLLFGAELKVHRFAIFLSKFSHYALLCTKCSTQPNVVKEISIIR